MSPDPITFTAAVVVDLTNFYVLDPITITSSATDAPLGADRPERAVSLHAAPNPFTETTTIHYSLERECAISLRVFDVTGRNVRLLAAEAGSIGDHALTWDGRGDSGLELANGFYFVRLDAGGASQTRKILRLDASPGIR